jgi:SOS-response transcriptional repressor LexA
MNMRYGAEPTKQTHTKKTGRHGQVVWRDERTRDEKLNAICDFVASFVSDQGYSPSYREIAKGTNTLSISTIEMMVAELVSDGRLERTKAPTRNIVPGEPR